ncbi:hypothetical protein, partial [Vibrio parahaemolyticus]|uniref:hypothetical protein n=1 Tax=Vibrio parahaemolyticus TaxID=670 RepID=UPI001C5F0C9A
AVSKRLSLKPLGIYNAVENGFEHQTNLFERQCGRADFQQANQRLKQKNQTVQGTKARFSQTQITRN